MTQPYLTPFPSDPKYLRAVEENVDPSMIYALHTGNAIPLRSHAGGDELVRWFDYVFMRYQLVANGNLEDVEYWRRQTQKYGEPARLAALKALLVEMQMKSMAGYLLTAMARLFRARIRGAGEIPLDIEPTTRAFLTGEWLANPVTGEGFRVSPTLDGWFRMGETMMREAAAVIEESFGDRARVLADFSTPESVFAQGSNKAMGAAPVAWTGWQAAVYIVGIVVAAGAITLIAMGIAALSTAKPMIDEMVRVWQQNGDAFDRIVESCESRYADQPEKLTQCIRAAQDQRDASNQRTTDTAMSGVGEVLDQTLGQTARTIRSSAWAGAVAAVGVAAALYFFSRGD